MMYTFVSKSTNTNAYIATVDLTINSPFLDSRSTRTHEQMNTANSKTGTRIQKYNSFKINYELLRFELNKTKRIQVFFHGKRSRLTIAKE